MKPLPTEFTKKDYRHRQLARSGDLALFERTNLKATTHSHFEVVRVQRHNGLKFPGQEEKSEPAEYYPSSSSWGTLGWTYSDSEKAWSKFREESR